MQAGLLLVVFAEIIGVLKASAYIKADGSFDEAKLNDIGSDLGLAQTIVVICKKYGVAVPPNVDLAIGVVADVVAALKADGLIKDDGSFDAAKLNDVPTILQLIGSVEVVLKKYKIAIPAKVDQILQIVGNPLLAGLFR